MSSYRKKYLLDRHRGIDRSYVDAAAVATHLHDLVHCGATMRGVSDCSGVGEECIRLVLSGARTQLQRTTAAALAAVTIEQIRHRPIGRLDATGTRRRIQALFALGWRRDDLAASAGGDIHQFTRSKFVDTATYWRVVDVYEKFSMRPGPSRLTMLRALNAGWPPPLAWDDDTIDDRRAKPAHRYHSQKRTPDDVAVLRRAGGDVTVTLNRAERRQLITQLHAVGLNDVEIANRTGLWDRQVHRDRRALGLPANVDAHGNRRTA